MIFEVLFRCNGADIFCTKVYLEKSKKQILRKKVPNGDKLIKTDM